jgi:hypothetical protein
MIFQALYFLSFLEVTTLTSLGDIFIQTENFTRFILAEQFRNDHEDCRGPQERRRLTGFQALYG